MEKKAVPEEIHRFLMQYQWPGNIRELEHIILKMFIMAGSAPELNKKQIPFPEKPFIAEETVTEDPYEQVLNIISGKVILSGLPLKKVTGMSSKQYFKLLIIM